MTLSEFESKRVEKRVAEYVARRRPAPEQRPAVDLGYRLRGDGFEIFRLCDGADADAARHEQPVARGCWESDRGCWRVLCMRQDGRWRSYPWRPAVPDLEAFFLLLDRDTHATFWG